MRRLIIAALALIALAPFLFGSSAVAQAIGGWNVNASGTGATATATHTALNTSLQDVVYGVDASCATTPAAPILLQVKDKTTVVWQGYITTPFWRDWPAGITIIVGDPSVAVLASCGGSVVGQVNLHGVSR